MRRRSLRSWWTICFRRSSPRIRWVWWLLSVSTSRIMNEDHIGEISLSEDQLSQVAHNMCPRDHHQDQLSKYANQLHYISRRCHQLHQLKFKYQHLHPNFLNVNPLTGHWSSYLQNDYKCCHTEQKTSWWMKMLNIPETTAHKFLDQ